MFGKNCHGEIGDNSTENKSVPIDITDKIIQESDVGNEFIINASCGKDHTVVMSNKSLYTFGSNEEG